MLVLKNGALKQTKSKLLNLGSHLDTTGCELEDRTSGSGLCRDCMIGRCWETVGDLPSEKRNSAILM